MKENVGVIYDSSPRVADVVDLLRDRLSLRRRQVRPVAGVSAGCLLPCEVLMLVSCRWSEPLLPGEWHAFFEHFGVSAFSGRTLVPVATSVPLAVSLAPALRRMLRPVCVRIISPVEVFFIPEGHFAEAGNDAGATRQVDEWLSVFVRCGEPADED